jgi:hypothetical protein
MKLHPIAIAAAMLAAASSSFAAPAVVVDNAATVRIYMAGATALRNTIAGIVLNDICGGTASNNTTTLYNMTESGTGYAFAGNFWAITCKVTAAGGAKIGVPANTSVAFFKSDAGGSAQGVFPVYFGTQRPFVEPADLSKCVATTADRLYTACPATRLATPMLGMSDVEPKLFAGANVPNDILDNSDDTYPSAGLTDSQITELTVTPVVQTLFAVAVNNILYNDMFAKQGLGAKFSSAGALCTTSSTDENCVPSIGQAEGRGIFAGSEANWRQLSNNAALIDSQVNVCRRVQGSGTQAAANLQFAGFPCNSAALSPADFTFSSSAAPEAVSSAKNTTESGKTIGQYLIDNMGGGTGTGPMPQSTTFYFEGPGTGDVISCLNAAQKAGGYAIGHVSKENVPATSGTIGQWKHVKLEGALPDGNLAKQGRYDYVVESTIQYKTSAFSGLSAAQKSFITGFTSEIAKPDSLAKLPAANQNGVLALPTAYAGAFGTGTTNEIKFGSRVSRGGNSCQPLAAVK